MITCKQATEFVLKLETEKISFARRLQLLSHFAICKFCRAFFKQNAIMNQGLNKQPFPEQLSSADKEHLLQHTVSQT